MKFRLIEKLVVSVIVCLLLSACGQGMQDWFYDNSRAAPGDEDVTIQGTVSGTKIVAVDASSNAVAASTVAGAPQADGARPFTLKVHSKKDYKLYLIENDGTSNERVFPLTVSANDRNNKFNIANSVTINLGYIDTSSGYAVPQINITVNVGVTIIGQDLVIPPAVSTNSPVIYTQADLTGTWYLFQFHAGLNPYYSRGVITFDSNGAGTVTNGVSSNGHISTNNDALLFMTPSGVVINILNSASNTRYIMSSDKSLMVGVGNSGLADAASMTIAVKAGSGFQQRDLAGTWKGHALVASSTSREWQRADITIDSGGVPTLSSNFQRPSGPAASGGKFVVMTMNNNNVVTAPTNSFYGAMTLDKNLLVCTYLNGDGTIAFDLFVRTGGTGFSIADLTGSWRSNWLAIGATSDMWVRSLLVIGSNGSATSYGIVANGLSEPNNTSSDITVVGPSGLITSNVAQYKLEGIISLNKKLVVYTRTNLDRFQLGILMR